ncbi:MAG TPA: NAD(P)H-hydrate dehydratase [Gammaproteobacteria bacterium]|nr:NAD(P)H-hydrate dehydratase [Gammaproteobacteria bacterium]
MRDPDESLPIAVYSASQVRELDRRASAELSVPSFELMSRAGAQALRVLRRRWPEARSVVVLCGGGNNGGDGLVLARLAKTESLDVRVLAVAPPERLKGDAKQALEECVAAGVAVERFAGIPSGAAATQTVIVDALLGIGADRPLEGDYAAAVAAANASGLPILALDVPSGLHADLGLPLGEAIRASATVTFVGLKQGLYLGQACDYTGPLELADLGLAAELAHGLTPALTRLAREELKRALPPRRRSAHKGTSGRLLLYGGGPGMAGAIRLAAEAALRVGSGLVYVAAHDDSVAAVRDGRAEVIVHAVDAATELDPLVALADAAVVGPGLGLSAWARAGLRRLLDSGLPLIVDADALNLLAESPVKRGHWILTPHPGEAARLLETSVEQVERNRLAAVRALAARYDGVAVLKGAQTLVASGDAPPGVCDRGNPGMATAGMGDVLAGVLGGLLVQTRDLRASARAGVLLHALAGDDAAAAGQRGTLAADLMPHLRRWANPTA